MSGETPSGAASNDDIGPGGIYHGIALMQGFALNLGMCNQVDEINLGVSTPPGVNLQPFTGFSSQHVGGAHFLLCDGSVRFISENIATGPPYAAGSTYQNLATRNDGRVLGEF